MSIFQTQPGGWGEKQPVKFRFLQPAQMTIRRPSGVKVLMGYGIGDIIEVMQYPGQYAIPGETLAEVELSDGSVLLNEGQQIQLERVK